MSSSFSAGPKDVGPDDGGDGREEGDADEPPDGSVVATNLDAGAGVVVDGAGVATGGAGRTPSRTGRLMTAGGRRLFLLRDPLSSCP